ncbi:TonB-dependent receptor [Sphingomonas sp. BN140010]|uniref:TonB-dependent receptor n=1 Tax=Sphingomonas arvum TaxID=2992113 RepID=A0ABT3JFU0_9SPHN|nr:TonB-dependent receptor [Sphingomonas sp. BN140010]MCW3797681.1 TonB-dependent receptor [Sphingomonas sp. BN140010]
MSLNRFARHLLGTVALVTLLPAAALAQDTTTGQPTPPAQPDPASAETPAGQNNATTQDQAATASDSEIVVTARRREESLQDVPIAVTAYSGEQLDRQGALDITDVADTTPNVTLETSRGTNSTLTAFIRGVGQQDPVAGFEGGVGIYLDDVYLNRPQGALLDIYDVERIEVLRGPQGTLYGRNTIGGAVKYVTRRLATTTEGRVRANVGTYKQADLVISASTPLTDTLRIGGAVARLSRDGFGKNLTTGKENYDKDILATRGTIEFEPADRAFFRLSGDYTWDRSNTRGGHRLIADLFPPVQFPVLDDEFDSRGGLVLPRQKITGGGLSLQGQGEIAEGLTLRSITAFRKDKSTTPIDFDALPAADVDVPAIYRNKQFSQEVQLLIDRGPLNGLVGAYYLKANANNVFDVVLDTTGRITPGLCLPGQGIPLAACAAGTGFVAGPFPGFAASTFGDVDTKTWAIFGDFTYRFTDQLSLSLGGRYTRDKRDAQVVRRNIFRGPLPELGGLPLNGLYDPVTNPTGRQLGPLSSNFTGEKTFKQFTPRASLAFEPDENNTLYVSWAKGFKGGGFDPRGVSTVAPDLNGNGVREADEIFDYFLFDPEQVTSYEAGYKASLFDRRLRLAAAVFHANYKDVQVPGSAGAEINGVPTFVGITTNAGKARFNGVEVEANAVLARGFAGTGSRVSLGGTIGYIDAKYQQFETNVAGFTANGTPSPATRARPVDVAAYRKIQNTPKWSNSASLDFAVPAGDGLLSANTTLSYKSKTYQFETPSPFLDQKSYSLLDANLIYSIGRFTVGLHGKNLLDKRYITSGYQFLNVNPVTGQPVLSVTPTSPVFGVPGTSSSLGLEGVVTAFYGAPRQVYLSLDMKF